MKNEKAKLIDANGAHREYCVTRAWLRSMFENGRIRRGETLGVDAHGRPYVRYLYNVEDIEKVLSTEGAAKNSCW